jgi:hypothetical protein
MQIITGADAYSALRRNRAGWWARHEPDTPPAASRTRKAFFKARVTPKFQLSLDDRIFTIGSCFARHIERHLSNFGYKFETLNPQFHLTPEECTSPQGFFNRFTTHSMLNDLRWGLGLAEFPEASYFQDEKGRWQDGQLPASFASKERALEIRRNVQFVTSAVGYGNVMVLTLGLVEAWYDNELKLYLNVAPPQQVVSASPGRYSLHILDYKSNYEALAEIYDIVKAASPDIKFIVTVSPVPLGATFSGQDVAVANSYSKSTLRAVAGDFAAANKEVQYYPSYEMVTESTPLGAWMPDAVHVNTEMVECVITYFLSIFLPKDEAAKVDLAAPEARLKALVAAGGHVA